MPFITNDMVKAVVFDLGKVLVDFDYSILARRVAAKGRMGAGEFMRYLAHTPAFVEFEKGLIGRRELFDQIVAATGYHGAADEFSRDFADIFTEIEPMTRLHAELRAAGVPTYIFSNTNDLAVDHIRSTFPFFSQFTDYVLSYEHGSMKPEPPLYAVVEARTGLRGADLLYIDDRAENIEAGAARGWRTILHHDPDQTVPVARSLALAG